MIIVNINNTRYSCPTKAEEISYKMGASLEAVVKEYPVMNIEGKKWILCTLLQVDYDVVDAILDSQILMLVDSHIFFNDQLRIIPSQYVKLKGIVYKFRDIEPCTVDMFAQRGLFLVNEDIEDLFFSIFIKVKWWKAIMPKLFLRNYKSFAELNYYQVKIPIYLYLIWKNNVLNEFNINSYNSEIPADQQSDEYILTPVERYGVYHIIMEICNGSLREYKEWQNEDIRVLFKYIRYTQIKNIK